MDIRPFWRIGERERYATREEMWKAWPEFHPDNMFDWSMDRGHFCGWSLWGVDEFLWVKSDGRYSLDDLTFENISASRRSAGLGYTDLVLTVEAIAHQAWKMLSYKGLRHFEQFLRDFPDVRRTYERAVWDAHTSISAKKDGMTVTEFLRARNRGFSYRMPE